MAVSLNGRILNPGSPLSLGGRQVRGVELIGGGGGGGGYDTVQEDGTSLTQRTRLNFGAGLTAVDDVPNIRTNVTLSQLNNYAAVVAPTAGDDSTAGYSVGSTWINTVTRLVYTCVSSAAAAAVWQLHPTVYARVFDPEIQNDTAGALPGVLNQQLCTNFPRTGDTQARYRFVMPPWYKGGDIRTRVLYAPDSAGGGTVRLQLSMEAQTIPHNMAADSFAAALVSDVAVTTVANELDESFFTFTNAQADSPAAGDMIRFNVQRQGTSISDTFAGLFQVFGVVIEEG